MPTLRLCERPPVRVGEVLEVAADIELDEPWVAIPSSLGRTLTSLDGEPEAATTYETSGAVPVRALTTGRAETRDTLKDDHSGQPLTAVRAGRGCEVLVRSGEFEVHYSHLRRGSGKSGFVRAGEPVGLSGNTGRCLNGKDRSFVKIAARVRGHWVRLDTLAEPIELEGKLNGKVIGLPKRVAPGELASRGFTLDKLPLSIDRAEAGEFQAGENQVELTLRRGSRVLARASGVALVEWQ